MALRERFTLDLDARFGTPPWPGSGSPGVRIAAVEEGLPAGGGGWQGDRFEARGVRLERTVGGVEGACAPDRQSLDRAVRFALQPTLLREGWLMLHASCAVGRRGAHLFVGPSGVGKTTLLKRLVALGAQPFGDEVALVRAGEVEAFPFQPWPAEGSAPIASLHLLVRGGEGSVELAPREAAVSLLRNALVYENGAASALALGAVEAIMAGAGGVRLTSVLDDGGSARRLWAALGELA